VATQALNLDPAADSVSINLHLNLIDEPPTAAHSRRLQEETSKLKPSKEINWSHSLIALWGLPVIQFFEAEASIPRPNLF
jgi:hypothetical protein